MFFLGQKWIFSKMSFQENSTLFKTCYFVSNKVLAVMVSVDFDSTSLVSPYSEFFALL